MEDDLQIKLKDLNLLPINIHMIDYLKSVDPSLKDLDLSVFDYVMFHKGEHYFYTKAYIEMVSKSVFESEFQKLLNEFIDKWIEESL